ncbi:hypothetical protein ACEPPN_013156 [Leptodophora sp. 'Broadleaf-Isolate-01']
MLYRRVNSEYVDANDKPEAVKYIDGTLKPEFKLRTTSKSKPVAGPDDLLLLLVEHWARDEFVFPTEDDRQSRPFQRREEANKIAQPLKPPHCDHDEDTDGDINSETECEDDINADNNPGSDDDITFDSEDDESDDSAADEDMDEYSGSDSGYNSDRTDITMTEDTNQCYTTEINGCREPLRQNLDAAKPSEFEEVCGCGGIASGTGPLAADFRSCFSHFPLLQGNFFLETTSLLHVKAWELAFQG